jgi:1-deoxy-D-xylulose-5-phosphate synthase
MAVIEVPTQSGLSVPVSPARLKEMDARELSLLAAEIRRFLVTSVAVTGGHLGSNLGVVELTIALHRVFSSPDDAIVWDTGHQAYVHKVVTGREHAFAGLRKRGGLSGYPNRAESAHDIVENSHASTALSYAYGLSRARQLVGDPRRVVAVVGDGALTGGVAYEALNNIGVSGANVIVVLNDNGRSYAPTVSRISSAGHFAGRDASPARDFFEALGLGYLGPVDGHDIVSLEDALELVSHQSGPVVVHVHTRKGRGYAPAESDEEKCLHDVSPFDPDTGKAIITDPGRLSYTEAFGTALIREAAVHPEIVAITAAMAGPTGLLGFRDRYPDRFFDVGIAEQHAVNAAAGMAMAGLRPVVAIYSTFLNRAWDQVYYDVGLHRLPVIFCLDRAGITGDDGPSHHGVLDMMLLTKVPGMTVLAPSCYEEVGNMLHEALSITTGPVAIRWPKSEARSAGVGTGLRARRLRSGSRVCLIGLGKLVAQCEEAARSLAACGLEVTVWDARVASPLDEAMIEDALRHALVVTVEDGITDGGVGWRIESALRLSAKPSVGPIAISCGVPTAYLPHGDAASILANLGLDGAGIARVVLEHLSRSAAPHGELARPAGQGGLAPL